MKDTAVRRACIPEAFFQRQDSTLSRAMPTRLITFATAVCPGCAWQCGIALGCCQWDEIQTGRSEWEVLFSITKSLIQECNFNFLINATRWPFLKWNHQVRRDMRRSVHLTQRHPGKASCEFLEKREREMLHFIIFPLKQPLQVPVWPILQSQEAF